MFSYLIQIQIFIGTNTTIGKGLMNMQEHFGMFRITAFSVLYMIYSLYNKLGVCIYKNWPLAQTGAGGSNQVTGSR